MATHIRDEEELVHRFLDGRLSDAEKAALVQRIKTEPTMAAIYAALTAQHGALRELHRDVLEQPIPPHLLHAATELESVLQRQRQWAQLGGMAAMVLLAFGSGWLAHTQWGPTGTTSAQLAAAPTAPAGGLQFVKQAVLAHAVFTPEVRHPVEVDNTQQEHLVQWLSKRLNRPLKLPQLTRQGFELMGGRLLPAETGARAQFMYQNAAGERLTLYLGAMQGGAEAATDTSTRETAFRFSASGTVNSFYWIDNGFGYALSGPVPRPVMQELAHAVYGQLMPK